jgi:hypothetical protein
MRLSSTDEKIPANVSTEFKLHGTAARLEVFTVILLRIQVFWHVTLCYWMFLTLTQNAVPSALKMNKLFNLEY